MKIGLRNRFVRASGSKLLTREITSIPLKADLGKLLKSNNRVMSYYSKTPLSEHGLVMQVSNHAQWDTDLAS
jgi:hypothetical protein